MTSLAQLKPEEQCCICLESLHKPGLGRQSLPCGHIMHESCITVLRRKGASGRCPICREAHNELTPVQVLLDKAFYASGRKQHEEYVRFLTDALDVDPSSAVANRTLAQHYHQGHGVSCDRDRAEELYRLALDAGMADAASDLGLLNQQRGDLQMAEKFYEDARRNGSAEGAHRLAKLHHRRGDLVKARDLYEEARRGGSAEAACELGMLADELGDISRAEELFWEARRGGDKDAAYLLGALNMCRAVPDFTGLTLMEEARRNGSSQAAYFLAVFYEKGGDLQMAKELYDEARRGGKLTAANDMGIVYENLGNVSKAEELYDEASQSGSVAAEVNLGTLLQKRGELQRAKRVFEKAHGAGSAEAAFQLGGIYMEHGDLVTAQKLYREAQRGEKVKAEATCALAIVHERLGDLKTALKLYDEAQHAGHAHAAYNLGVFHHEQGDLRLAEELYQKARHGGYTEAACTLGALNFQRGDLFIAEQFFKEAQRAGHEKATECLELLRPMVAESKSKQDVKNSPASASTRTNHAIVPTTGSALPSSHGSLARKAANSPGQVLAAWLGAKSGACSETSLGALRPMSSGSLFAVGDTVWIQDLTSEAGLPLNGRTGTIVSLDEETLRCGVDICGVGKKAIKAGNLKRVGVQMPSNQAPEELEATVEDVIAQKAIEESIREQSVPGSADAVNAQLSAALVHKTHLDSGPRILLLKFSRRPAALRASLTKAPELVACKETLEEHGFSSELPSGAKVFVSWEHYEPALEAVRLAGMKLFPDNVLVDESLEPVVLQLVHQLRGRNWVHPKDSQVVPLAFPQAALQAEHQIDVSRTFIHVRLPTSLLSPSQTGGERMVSTTDADPRKSVNHRRRRGKKVTH